MFPGEEIKVSINITNHLFLLIFQYLLILFDYDNNCRKIVCMAVIKRNRTKMRSTKLEMPKPSKYENRQI